MSLAVLQYSYAAAFFSEGQNEKKNSIGVVFVFEHDGF